MQDETRHPNKTTVLEQLKLGRLVWLGDKGNEVNLGDTNSDSYEAQDMYVGKDKVTFMTELAGREIKVVHYIRATDKTVEIDNFQKIYKKYRPLRTWPMQGALESGENLVAWQRSANLSALIAEAQQSLTGFTDLPATALGQTTGAGATATITLDQNAAGHSWRVDPTPLDNTDDSLWKLQNP